MLNIAEFGQFILHRAEGQARLLRRVLSSYRLATKRIKIIAHKKKSIIPWLFLLTLYVKIHFSEIKV